MRRQSEKKRRTLMAVRGGKSCPLPAGPGSQPAPPTPSPVREVQAENLGRGKAQDQDTPNAWEELEGGPGQEDRGRRKRESDQAKQGETTEPGGEGAREARRRPLATLAAESGRRR